MKRLSKGEIYKIHELIMRGVSLREISSKMGYSKSTIQYHATRLRGKRPREKELLIERLTDGEVGWLIGCYTGDGSRYFRRETYSYEVKFALNRNEHLIAKFIEVILLKCGMKTRRSLEGERMYIKCQSKRLFKFMEKYLSWNSRRKSISVRLQAPLSYSDNFLFGFLCGLIDSDGGTRRLYISTSSKSLADNVREICNELRINTKTYVYDVYHVYLRRSDFNEACQKYKFSPVKFKMRS